MLRVERHGAPLRRRSVAKPAPRRCVDPHSASPVIRRTPWCVCGGSCPRCRAKSNLVIGAPDDAYEKEADAVADRVMRMADSTRPAAASAPAVQRACTACDHDDGARPQAKAERSAASVHGERPDAPASVDAALRSPGRPLDAGACTFFEPRLGVDLSAVRVHSDASAHESADAIDARAFTVGQDIVFGAGQFSPGTREGQRLLAHELTHVVQQSSGGVTPGVQRQSTPVPVCPASVLLSSGTRPIHVPACGATPVRASAQPANASVTWSLDAGSTQPGFPGAATMVAAGTTISNAAADAGTITVAPAQTPGFVVVDASGASGCGSALAQLNFASTPVGVGLTSVVGPLASSSTSYGARFENELTSASGNPAHLSHVRVNERFSGLATPNAATHLVPTPFGNFTLQTNPWTPNSAAPGWDVTDTGVMGPDNIGIERDFIDVGRFVASASNPTPATTLTPAAPVGFSVQQDLHWFCPQAAVGSQWITPPFTTLTHTRHLHLTSGDLTFVTGIPAPSLAATSDDYTGQPAIIRAAASFNPVTVSATVPRGSPRGTPRPTPNTTMVTADTLPSSLAGLTGTHDLRFSIRGPALGCTVNATNGEVTVGTTLGTITVRVTDVNRPNHNFDEVMITIVAAAAAPAPAPANPPPGVPHPGLYLPSTPGDVALPPPLPAAP